RALGLWVAGGRSYERWKVPRDHRQQVVEVVRDAAGELAERVHLLRMRPLGLRFVQGKLRLAALGDVAGDLREAEQGALLVADRVDDHVGPEQGAVLAHAPAFRLEPAILRGGVERARGQPGRTILAGVKA